MSKKYIEWIDAKIFNCLPLPYEQEFKSLTNFSYTEKIKDKAVDSRLSAYDNFYKPFELTAFHEIFYFNNLNTNRITNNSSTGGFSGNIKAILDPFMMRSRKNASNVSGLKDSSLKFLSTSDDESDESYDIIQETPFTSSFKNVTACDTFKESLINFEISEASFDIYKKYVDSCLNNTNGKSREKNLTAETLSTYSIISASNLNDSPVKKTGFSSFLTNKKFCPANFLKLKFNDLNCDPASVISSDAKMVYSTFLETGLHGAKEPTQSNIKIYEEYARQQQQQHHI